MDGVQGVIGCGDAAKMVAHLSTRCGALEAGLLEAERARRKLHNELVEIRGNIRVFARIRPAAGRAAAAAVSHDAIRLHVDGKPADFYFDRYATPAARRRTCGSRAARAP